MKTKSISYIAFNDSDGEFCLSREALEWMSERGWSKAYDLLCEIDSHALTLEKVIKIDETMIGMTRHTPLLALCLSELGSLRASGPNSFIRVRETTSSRYFIKCLGGMETVITPQDIEWIEIK
tara:strand:+ start:179 stop:547 length:369 start_codon:yes stop_codon:yes gene_type:complete